MPARATARVFVAGLYVTVTFFLFVVMDSAALSVAMGGSIFDPITNACSDACTSCCKVCAPVTNMIRGKHEVEANCPYCGTKVGVRSISVSLSNTLLPLMATWVPVDT